MVMTRRRIRKNLTPSGASRIFDWPILASVSVGSNATLYPALINASVVVVGVENPFGNRWRNSTSIVAASRTETGRQVVDLVARKVGRQPREQPVAESASDGGLRTVRAGSDNEVILTEPFDQARRQRRAVLSVPIDDQDEVARGLP